MFAAPAASYLPLTRTHKMPIADRGRPAHRPPSSPGASPPRLLGCLPVSPTGLCAALITLALLPFGASAVPPEPAGIQEMTLSNGLQVLVKPDHRAPVVVSQVWYKLGSSFEHLGITGISHALEHMMFKGTPSHPAGEFSRIIAANGGSENAFTSHDYTAYYQQLEKSRLPISFELEADRMRNLTLPAEEFAKEIRVVQEERRLRTEDKPRSVARELFRATAFVSSGYHWPVIGWMGDLKVLRVEELRDWYRTWYAPNNAVLVVVGDVDPQQVFKLARQYFGPLPPTEPAPAPKPTPEITQQGERRVTVKRPAKLPYLLLGYQVPVLREGPDSWEPYALEMLAWVLDGDDSSRLSKHLIRGSQVAAGTSISYDLYARSRTLMQISAVPTSEHSPADLERGIRAQIARLRDEPVEQAELDRVRAKVIAGKVYEKDSIFSQAAIIGQLAAVGLDPRLDERYADRIRAVTPEQIQAVAQKYLTDDRLTVALLDPLPMDPQAPSPSTRPLAGDDRHGHPQLR
jgi:zinc protease